MAQVRGAVKNKIGKHVNLVMNFGENHVNGCEVYANSAIQLRIKGIEFLFFTPKRK